jgi:hypothetical protein
MVDLGHILTVISTVIPAEDSAVIICDFVPIKCRISCMYTFIQTT